MIWALMVNTRVLTSVRRKISLSSTSRKFFKPTNAKLGLKMV